MSTYDEVNKTLPGPVFITDSCIDSVSRVLGKVCSHNKRAIRKRAEVEVEKYTTSVRDSVAEEWLGRERQATVSWTVEFTDDTKKTGLTLEAVRELPNRSNNPIHRLSATCGWSDPDGATANWAFDGRYFHSMFRFSVRGPEELVTMVSKELEAVYREALAPYARVRATKELWGAVLALVILYGSVLLAAKISLTRELTLSFVNSASFSFFLILGFIALFYLVSQTIAPRLWPSWECDIGAGKERRETRAQRRRETLLLVVGSLVIPLLIWWFTKSYSQPNATMGMVHRQAAGLGALSYSPAFVHWTTLL